MIDFTKLNKLRDELSTAINSNDIERVKSIINREAPTKPHRIVNLNYLDQNGQTPLHLACIIGSLEMCKLLMESGASQAIKNRDGWFPIHLASYLGHLDVIVYLIENGESEIDVYESTQSSSVFRSHENEDDDYSSVNSPVSSDCSSDSASDEDEDDCDVNESTCVDKLLSEEIFFDLENLDLSARDFQF